MEKDIIYNGILFKKHPKQKYFYSAETIKRTKCLYSRSLHRQMWFDVNGEIPKGHSVHHKDGNAFNNSIDNFELINNSEHAKLHSRARCKKDPSFMKRISIIGREAAKEWHSSKEGIEWHRQNALKTGFGKFDYGNINCLFCNKEFTKKSYQNKFCSNNCKSANRRKTNPDKGIFNCINCNKEFISLKYLPNKYCSKECRPTPNPLGYYARSIVKT